MSEVGSEGGEPCEMTACGNERGTRTEPLVLIASVSHRLLLVW